jgi:hypothetical protein
MSNRYGAHPNVLTRGIGTLPFTSPTYATSMPHPLASALSPLSNPTTATTEEECPICLISWHLSTHPQAYTRSNLPQRAGHKTTNIVTRYLTKEQGEANGLYGLEGPVALQVTRVTTTTMRKLPSPTDAECMRAK